MRRRAGRRAPVGTYARPVLILLPPSETKHRPTRGRPMEPTRLSFPALAPTRERVGAALREVSAQDDATQRLGVSPGLAAEVAGNLRLLQAPAAPARALYTGVLYDALDLAHLEPAAKRRAQARLVVVSALYGAVRMNDRVAPYRLSMGVTLPEVGRLAAAWRPALDEVLPEAAGRGAVVDCRSSTYVAAWQPRGDLARRWVTIRVPGATHQAKHTRGLVAAHLCRTASAPRTPQAVADALADAFDVSLAEPERAGRPWTLDALPRTT